MARKEKKFNYLYKITNIKNNKYYIGMHSTDNLNDGYMGGGKRIRNSIRKHGKDSHIKEILEYFDDRTSLRDGEFELINEDLLNDPMCMNLQPGGGGGCTENNKIIWQKAGSDGLQRKLKSDKDFNEKWRIVASKSMLERHKSGEFDRYDKKTFIGRNHTTETISKMIDSKKNHGLGEKNSQFGTIWVNNGLIEKKVNNNIVIDEEWTRGRIKK